VHQGKGSKAYTKAMNDYADALSTKKIYCKHGKDYSKKRCKRWTMRTDEYHIAMDLHAKNATSEKAETVRLAKEAAHDEDNAQMVIKIMMKKGKLTFLEATALISLFIIGTFEILGIMIGSDYMKYRDMLSQYGIDLHRNKAIRYLKKDFKRKKQEHKENSQYAIYQAEQTLKKMQRTKVARSELQRLHESIRTMTPTPQPAYAHQQTAATVPPAEPVASSGFTMGFVDTNTHEERDAIPPAPPVNPSMGAIEVGLDLGGYSLEQLQTRREDYKRIGGDTPLCPACNLPFVRQTWQDVFCNEPHRVQFNNQLRRLKRAIKKGV
jgi:hypothetical protein